MAISGTFDFRIGEDVNLPISMRPAQDVTGWTVQFTLWSASVTVTFPPATILPLDTTIWPIVPLWSGLTPNLAVIPGIQPKLPATGTTTQVVRDNALATGITIIDAARGIFVINLPRATTINLPAGLYWWEFRRVDSGLNHVEAEGSAVALSGG